MDWCRWRGHVVERCFYELNGTRTFHYNWHLTALAWQLSEVAAERVKRLVFTLPPRSLKSLSASVAPPAWILSYEPDRRITCAIYGADLAIDHANGFRAILESDWYQWLFPITRIDPRKETEAELRTTPGGYRLSTTVGGALAGRVARSLSLMIP